VSLGIVVERFALAEERRSPFPLTPGAEGSQGSGDDSMIANSPRRVASRGNPGVKSKLRALRPLLRVRR
jgi:hypothetical protein